MKKTILLLLAALAFCLSSRAQESVSQDVRSKRPVFLGVNGAVSAPIGLVENRGGLVFGTGLKAGLDFAYPISDNFAMGAYLNLGGGPAFFLGMNHQAGISPGPFLDVKAGLLMLAGDLRNRPYIIGIAPFTGIGICGKKASDHLLPYLPAEVRFGRVLSDNLYITGNLNIGVSGLVLMFEPGISIGYNFGHRLKK